ncbi:VPA1269 family protein [Neorhizobium sp. BETTINA12A]|uniref:VPA1269 family protein n=1 Tax=Neorhizobium sp. BETTINA12A TaxID=2908924 RepID=UPI001FF6BDDD|nr:VPA1269 family protein [Neorhizobium sp. BETTINA12A]MCJ9753065.1 VPA1269 family protein [Neorhizobium sp. BETTINA12A]
MLSFQDRNGNTVFLNLTDEDAFNDGAPLTAEVQTALQRIRKMASNRQLKDSEIAAADLIFDEGVVFSPWNVLKKQRHLNAKICTHLNNQASFGVQLRELLDDVGAFDFLQRVADKGNASSMMERLITLFAMCTTGLDDPQDAPVELIQRLVDHLRSEDGLRWKAGIFGANPLNLQCASQFVLGLSKIYPDAKLEEKARQHRRAVGRRDTWVAFQAEMTDPRRSEILRHFKSFEAENTVDPSKAITAVRYVASWLDETAPGQDLLLLSASRNRDVSFSQYMKKRVGSFTQHVVDAVKTARNFCDHMLENLESDSGREDLFPLISEREVQTTKNEVGKTTRRRTTAAARPLPERIHWLVRDLLDEGEDGWPGLAKVFKVNIVRNGQTEEIFCPVGPTLLRAAFDIPVRMGSLRRLDSGEGDVTRFNADAMAWEDNEGALAGYWADAAAKPRRDFEGRGYARLIRDPLKDISGFFINTNKTGEPHEIPWEHERLHKSLYQLRKWQEKFNPITKPISPEIYLDSEKRVSNKAKKNMPDIFPLMRMFPTPTKPHLGRIISHHELERMWTEVLREAEVRYAAINPDQAIQLIRREANGQWRPLYGLHGLRVRGITDLRRSGMPLEIISKFIAGHSTLMMTAYYLKFSPAEIEDFISKAAENTQAARKLIDDCRTMSIEEARLRTVSLSPAQWEEVVDAGSSVEFCNVDFGFCPWDCTRCHDGGPLLRSSGDDIAKAIHGPVPGGRHNCIMCRHFVSGPPFLLQLTAYGTKLCEKREHLAKEESRINLEVGMLETHFKQGTVSKDAFRNRCDVLQQQLIAVKDDQVVTESSIFNVELLCNASVRLMDEVVTDGVTLVAGSRESVIEYTEVTPFQRNVWLTAASRIYPVLGEPRVEQSRDLYIDLVLHNSGFTPPRLMPSISQDQCKQAMDQYAQLLVGRVSADDTRLLAEGELKLRDVGLEAEVRALMDAAIAGSIALTTETSSLPAITSAMEVA